MEVPKINKIKFIINEGISGIRLGSLKYLNVESNIMLFTEELSPLIVANKIIINKTRRTEIILLFNLDLLPDFI